MAHKYVKCIKMPGLNRTGPRGLGPMTGGGFGLCTDYSPTSSMPYSYRQPMMPPMLNANYDYMQNQYGVQNQSMYSMQQPYYGGFPFGWGARRGLGLGWGRGLGSGYGRGFGMGIAYRRGMGWGGRGAYGFW